MSFFDELEAQLRKATAGMDDRNVSLPWWKRRTTMLVVGLAAAALVTPAIASVTGVWSPDNGPNPPMTTVPSDVSRSSRGHPSDLGITDTHELPSPGLLRVLGVLRRPRTQADRFPGVDRLGALGVSPFNLAAIRYVGATPSGVRYYVIPTDRRPPPRPGRPGPARTCLLTEKQVEKHPALRKRCHLPVLRLICVLTATGSGGCGDTARSLARRGSFGASSVASGSTEVYGLIPDGVATVATTYRDGSTRMFPVHNNFYSYAVNLPPERATPSRITWRRADGRVIRVIRP